MILKVAIDPNLFDIMARFRRWIMIRPCEGEAVILREVQVAQDVVKVEMNCTKVVETDPTIVLRSY